MQADDERAAEHGGDPAGAIGSVLCFLKFVVLVEGGC
jgi:hypothetical protein